MQILRDFVMNLNNPKFIQCCIDYIEKIEKIQNLIREEYSRNNEGKEISVNELQKALFQDIKWKMEKQKFLMENKEPMITVEIELTNKRQYTIPINEMLLKFPDGVSNIWKNGKVAIMNITEGHPRRSLPLPFYLGPSQVMKLDVSFISNAFETAPTQRSWILSSFCYLHTPKSQKSLLIRYCGDMIKEIDISSIEIRLKSTRKK